MQRFSPSLTEMVASQWRNRNLIRNLIVREVVGRYKGSTLGVLWSLITPILMLIVYTFVFSEVFNARWGGGTNSKTEFALILFAGLMIFNLFAECISRAPGIVLANVNYVKKVIFPLEILPLVVLGSALFHFSVSFLVWLTAYVYLNGAPHWTVMLLPLIVAPFALFVLGLSWLLAAFGVFLRDIGQFIGIAVQVLMFMSPIFYPITALPEHFRNLLYLSPLTLPIEMARKVMYWGEVPDLRVWGLAWLVALGVAALGFACFQKTRKGFSDVL